MSEGTSMAKWPNFFIVGAARAGTTSLYHHLRHHPDIYMPSIKEPHFFSRVPPDAERLRYLTMKVITKEEEYLRLFDGAEGKRAIGEASPSYLYYEDVANRIKEKVPQAKILIVLREPVDRAYSEYLADVREGAQKRSFYEALMENRTRRRKAWGVGHLYLDLGLYYEQVKRYLDTFGSEQVQVYLYEDLAADTSGLVREVCAFLDVLFYDGAFFDASRRYNTYAMPRNALASWLAGNRVVRSLGIALIPKQLLAPLRDRLLLTKASKPPIDPRARDFLQALYREDILKLQELIGRDLSAWLAENSHQTRSRHPGHPSAGNEQQEEGQE